MRKKTPAPVLVMGAGAWLAGRGALFFFEGGSAVTPPSPLFFLFSLTADLESRTVSLTADVNLAGDEGLNPAAVERVVGVGCRVLGVGR